MYIYTPWFTVCIVRGNSTVVLWLISFHFVRLKWIYLSIWWPNMQHIYYRWPPRWNLKLKSHWFWNNLICYRDPVSQLVKLAKLHRSHSPQLPAPENHPPAPLLQSGNPTKGWSAPNLERRIRETSKYRPKPGSKICCPDLRQALTQICQFTHPGPNTSYSEWQKLGEIILKQIQTLEKCPLRFKQPLSPLDIQWVNGRRTLRNIISLKREPCTDGPGVNKAIQFLSRLLPPVKSWYTCHPQGSRKAKSSGIKT